MMADEGIIEDATARLVEQMSPQRRADYETAQLYRDADMPQLHERGVIDVRPHGDRIMIRSIRSVDASPMHQPLEADARDCSAYVVLGVGAGCAKWYDDRGIPESERVRVGDHVFAVAAATDRGSKTDRNVRIGFVRAEHIVSRWTPPNRQ